MDANNINASLVQLRKIEKSNVPMVSKLYLGNIEKSNVPIALVEFLSPVLPKLDSPKVKANKNIIFLSCNFIDVGIGKITNCGFYVGKYIGFDNIDSLQNFKISNTNNADTSKLVTIDNNCLKIASTNNQTTKVSYTVNGPANLFFKWKVSSELKCDIFKFFIDRTEQKAISGEVDWEQQNIPINSGEHVIDFTYQKDGSRSLGNDCGWIDEIIIVKDGLSLTGEIILNDNNKYFYCYMAGLPLGVSDIVAYAENDAGKVYVKTSYDNKGAITINPTAQIKVGDIQINL